MASSRTWLAPQCQKKCVETKHISTARRHEKRKNLFARQQAFRTRQARVTTAWLSGARNRPRQSRCGSTRGRMTKRKSHTTRPQEQTTSREETAAAEDVVDGHIPALSRGSWNGDARGPTRVGHQTSPWTSLPSVDHRGSECGGST